MCPLLEDSRQHNVHAMYKHPHYTNSVDMNYLVPGLAFFTGKEFGLVMIASRLFDILIAWTERMARRLTKT